MLYINDCINTIVLFEIFLSTNALKLHLSDMKFDEEIIYEN